MHKSEQVVDSHVTLVIYSIIAFSWGLMCTLFACILTILKTLLANPLANGNLSYLNFQVAQFGTGRKGHEWNWI